MLWTDKSLLRALTFHAILTLITEDRHPYDGPPYESASLVGWQRSDAASKGQHKAGCLLPLNHVAWTRQVEGPALFVPGSSEHLGGSQGRSQ